MRLPTKLEGSIASHPLSGSLTGLYEYTLSIHFATLLLSSLPLGWRCLSLWDLSSGAPMAPVSSLDQRFLNAGGIEKLPRGAVPPPAVQTNCRDDANKA